MILPAKQLSLLLLVDKLVAAVKGQLVKPLRVAHSEVVFLQLICELDRHYRGRSRFVVAEGDLHCTATIQLYLYAAGHSHQLFKAAYTESTNRKTD